MPAVRRAPATNARPDKRIIHRDSEGRRRSDKRAGEVMLQMIRWAESTISLQVPIGGLLGNPERLLAQFEHFISAVADNHAGSLEGRIPSRPERLERVDRACSRL
jgi:hypothetical protein